MRIPPELRCQIHQQPFASNNRECIDESDVLICPEGCRVPVVNGIPRFVSSEHYATSFGLQWNTFRKTQLDSHTGTTISRDRLIRCLGGSLDVVRGKSVLDAGCGAGRFSEILLSAGARLFACDLSEAVEANYANCSHMPDYFVSQANILQLPVLPQAFDIVLCLGVIQHTPDPEQTIAKLAGYVKPGGMLVIDHYAHTYPHIFTRKILRRLLLRLPPASSQRIVVALTRSLLPVHKLFWRKQRGMSRMLAYLCRVSPVVDYYGAYSQLGPKLLEEWAILDTHDTLTDRYKHLRSAEQIRDYLASSGWTGIEVSYGGNGVEARARKAVAKEQGLSVSGRQ